MNLVAGASFEVGGGLESRAPEFQSCSFSLRDELVTLIDTPNFDNTERPQTEGLMQIEVFLKKMYESEKRLAGVLYMHSISDRRTSGGTIKNYRLLRTLCGDIAMENVVIVTNKWEVVSSDEGTREELELQKKHFKDAMDRGARMRRHDNTLASAQRILLELLCSKDPQTRFQDELVAQLDEEEKKHQRRLDQLRVKVDQIPADSDEETRRDTVDYWSNQLIELEETIRMIQSEREMLWAGSTLSLKSDNPH